MHRIIFPKTCEWKRVSSKGVQATPPSVYTHFGAVDAIPGQGIGMYDKGTVASQQKMHSI